MNNEVFLIKVSSSSRAAAVAGSIAHTIREGKTPIIRAIGAGAVNQAVKALAVARSYLQEDGIDLTTSPSFVELEVEDEERTALEFEVLKRAVV
jgi:stage V sporulation protein S